MTYHIRKSIDIDFSHHVRGHSGPCINVHGHTWKFEVEVKADRLDHEGFVVDFKRLKNQVLKPCHKLLDHGLAVGADTYADIHGELALLGQNLVASRVAVHGAEAAAAMPSNGAEYELCGAKAMRPGGIKVAVFPFAPTSERIAKWLYDLASSALDDERVKIHLARVYETLHPVEAVAEYRP